MSGETSGYCGSIWQLQHMAFAEDLFLHEASSDVIITVQSSTGSWRYPAHKKVLCTASFFFGRTFRNPLCTEILINNFKPKIIFLILQYIYKGNIDLDVIQKAVSILHAAQKFELLDLAAVCEEYLTEEVTLSNVCCLLANAYLYNLDILKAKCLKVCAVGACVILDKQAFFELEDKEVVKAIVSLPELNVLSEMHIAEALCKWATLKCCRQSKTLTEENIFSELQEMADFINFQDMTPLEINELPDCFMPIISKLNLRDLPNNVTSSWFKRQRMTLHFTDQVLETFDSIKLRFSEYRKLHIPSNCDESYFTAGYFIFSDTVILGGVEISFKSPNTLNHCPIHFITVCNMASELKRVMKKAYCETNTVNGEVIHKCKYFSDVIELESRTEYAFDIECSQYGTLNWHHTIKENINPVKNNNYYFIYSKNTWAIQTLYVHAGMKPSRTNFLNY